MRNRVARPVRAAADLHLGEPYDDGGFSGGTLDRPALKRLLADIEGGEAKIREAFPK